MGNLLLDRLQAFHANATSVKTRLDYEEQNLARLKGKILQIEQDKTQLVMALGLIDKAIGVISANGIGKIESIVTSGLRLVFSDQPDIAFVVEKKETANRGNAYRLLVRYKGVTAPPMDNFGGGVTNVISFLLRVVMVKKFKLAKFLVMDESFNNVNGALYRVNTSRMLHQLCDESGYSVLVIDGENRFTQAADHVYELTVDEQDRPSLHELKSEELDELHAAAV